MEKWLTKTWEIMECKGYFQECMFMKTHFSANSSSTVIRIALLLVKGKETPSRREIYVLLLGRYRRAITLLASVDSQYSLAERKPMPKWHILV